MDEAAIIGIDLAKRVFQLHAAGDDGRVLYRETLSRSQMLRFLARQPRVVSQCLV